MGIINRIATEEYVNNNLPQKLSDLEIDVELGIKSWDDLEDKPFETKYEFISLIETQEVICSNTEGVCCYYNTSSIVLEKTYKVVWDNVSYFPLTCELQNDNSVMLVSDKFLPFRITSAAPGYYACMVYSSDSESLPHTVSIYEAEETVKQIDEKFVPPHNHSWNNLDDKPFGEEENVIFDGNVDWETSSIYELTTPLNLVEGNEYIAILDGVEYKGTATFDADEGEIVVFPTLDGSGEQSTFRLFNTYLQCTTAIPDGIYSMKIIDVANSTVKQIDKKFVPSDTLVVTNKGDGTSSHSANEIYEAKNNGKVVIFIHGDSVYHLEYAELDPASYAGFSRVDGENICSFSITGSKISQNYITSIGNTNKLKTDNKTIVSAINEVIENTLVNANTNSSEQSYSPIEDTDLTTKKYVNEAIQNIDLSSYETIYNASLKLDEAKSYTNTSIANLVNSAPETLDTLGELATAMSENEEVIDTLNAAITKKQDKNLIVNLSSTTAEDGTVTHSADKTFEEIKLAYDNGTNVYLLSSGIKFELNTANTNLWFNAYAPNASMAYHTVKITSDNVVTLTSKSISATSYFYGGIKADTKSETDTVPAKIGNDGKLYVPTYPSLDGYATETYVSDSIALKADAVHSHVISDVTDLQTTLDTVNENLDKKANNTDLTSHMSDITIHITSDERTKWNSAIQSIVTGTANGTISVDGSDVAVKGLTSVAYMTLDEIVNAVIAALPSAESEVF